MNEAHIVGTKSAGIELVRDEGPAGVKAWSCSGVHLVRADGKLYVIDDFEVGLNVEISDSNVRFLVGTPAHLRRALLVFAGEQEASALAAVAPRSPAIPA